MIGLPTVLNHTDITLDTWNDLLGGCINATVFHTREWMMTLQEAFHYDAKYLASMGPDGGTFYAAMPFMVDTRFGFENYLSMPFDTYGGVIGDPECTPGLLDAFNRLPGQGVRYYVDYTKPGAVSTELADISSNDLWTEMHKDNRTAIKSAQKHGVITMKSNWYHPSAFDKVPRKLVSAITRNMIPAGLCIQYLAEYEGEIAAASLFFVYGNHAIYWANTVTEQGRKTNANYLLMWDAIETLKQRGVTTLNLGASPNGADSLIRFKKSWGSTTQSYSKVQTVPLLMKPVMAVREALYG